MVSEINFKHSSRGSGRPQVVLLGNGLERKSGQVSWDQLVDDLTVEDALPITKEQKDNTPFPLLYQLLSTHAPASARLNADDVCEEENRLADVMKKLTHQSNAFLDLLPSLDADHIMTTNYSYCIESTFFKNLDFTNPKHRNKVRFRLDGMDSDKSNHELHYRLRTGYLGKSATRDTGIWHIHGECCVPKGIVLGHDRYGRLFQRIERICERQRYSGNSEEVKIKNFTSWPELFLYADVYILGLKMYECEFDLWWLLRRKQRERYSDGRVYFYEMRPKGDYNEIRHLLLKANGVILCDAGVAERENYDLFYEAALADIKNRIESSRK